MMRFSLSNLRLRLLGGFLLVVIMTVVAGGGGIFALHKIHTNMAAVTVEVSGSIERQRRHIGRAMKVRDLIDEINRVGDLFGVDQVATHLHNYAEENRTSTHDQGCESIGFLEQLLVLRSRQLKAAAERSQLSRVAEKQLREIDSYVAQTVDDLTFDALIAMEDTLKEVQRKPLEGVMDFRGRFERFSSTTDQAISQIKSALAIRSYSLQLHVVVKNVLLSSDPPYVDYALEQLRTLHRNVDSELHRLPEADATRLLAASLEDIQKVTPDLLLAQKEMIISEQAVQQKSEELSQSTVRMNADMLAKADELVESVIGKQEENARFIGRYRIALFLVAASACLVGIICSRQMLRAIARDIEARKRAAEARDLVNDRQAKLNRLQQSLLGSDELSEKLKRITDGVVDIFGADFCRIWITQPGDRCESGCMHADITEGPHVCRYRDRCLWLRASSGRYTHIDGEVHKRVPFGCYKIGLVASGENSKFLTNEAATDPRVHNNAWAKELGLVSFAGYQLRPPNGETIGVLALFAKHAIAPDEDALLESLGSTAAQVIQKARAEEEVTERNRFLNSVLESLTHPFVVIDAADYSVLMANSAARRNAPPAAETCHAMTHRRDTPCDGGEHVCPLVEIKRTGKPITVEHTHYDADGNPRTSEVHAYPILDNTGRVVQGIEYSVDITERKQAQAMFEDVQKQLRDASHRAGMAEVATDVLHNVGNVLNSVNVSAGLVHEKIRGSRVPGLAKATALMSEHANDLGTFITQDERGKQLPGYLTKLAEHLTDEQTDVLGELRHLAENIDHIKNIVSMQQSLTGVSGVTEPVRIGDLLDDLLKMDAPSRDRHGINVVREYDELPAVTVDKHKLTQILVNLLKNAKEALTEYQGPDKRLTVRLSSLDEDRAQIEVIDNAVGISPENLTKIFAHGFTTKENGHGFGLHGSALAANEIGGSLTAYSDGPGQGATFTLELPLHAMEKSDVHVAN